MAPPRCRHQQSMHSWNILASLLEKPDSVEARGGPHADGQVQTLEQRDAGDQAALPPPAAGPRGAGSLAVHLSAGERNNRF